MFLKILRNVIMVSDNIFARTVKYLQEAEEYRVHRHAVHREEGGGDGVRAEDDDGHRDKLVIQLDI